MIGNFSHVKSKTAPWFGLCNVNSFVFTSINWSGSRSGSRWFLMGSSGESYEELR